MLKQALSFLRWFSGTLACVGLIYGLLDYGAHADGPGIGYEGLDVLGRGPHPILIVGIAITVSLYTFEKISRIEIPPFPYWKWLRGVFVLVAILTAKPLLHYSWHESCLSGEGRACRALAELEPSGSPEQLKWLEKGMYLRDSLSSEKIIALNSGVYLPKVCKMYRESCLERPAKPNVSFFCDSAIVPCSKMLLTSGTDVLLASKDNTLSEERMREYPGKDVGVVSEDGTTALHWAAFHGKTEVVKELLSRGAPVNAIRETGGTALMAATVNGHLEIVKLLLAKGADPKARTKEGKSAFDFAVLSKETKVVEYMKAKHLDH
jgi:hypothetical protein